MMMERTGLKGLDESRVKNILLRLPRIVTIGIYLFSVAMGNCCYLLTLYYSLGSPTLPFHKVLDPALERGFY
jgi:hypothetical protein